MHRKWIAAAAIAAVTSWAPGAQAQFDESSRSPTGPGMEAAMLSPRPVESHAALTIATSATNTTSSTSATDVSRAARPLRTSEILMIVGGAGIITGAIIGGDAGTVIIIGGAGVGLYGLYLFLQEQRMSESRPGVGIGYRYNLLR
jgi:hypothetical protein